MIERLECEIGDYVQITDIVGKLNEVIDSHNRHSELLDQIADKVLVEPKESAKKTSITIPPKGELHLENPRGEDLVLVVESGDAQGIRVGSKSSPIPTAKKEETPGPPDDRTLSKEEVEQLAVDAYKKRLVEKLEELRKEYEETFTGESVAERAIKLVEETE